MRSRPSRRRIRVTVATIRGNQSVPLLPEEAGEEPAADLCEMMESLTLDDLEYGDDGCLEWNERRE